MKKLLSVLVLVCFATTVAMAESSDYTKMEKTVKKNISILVKSLKKATVTIKNAETAGEVSAAIRKCSKSFKGFVNVMLKIDKKYPNVSSEDQTKIMEGLAKQQEEITTVSTKLGEAIGEAMGKFADDEKGVQDITSAMEEMMSATSGQ